MRAKFRYRVGVGRYKIWFVQYKNHYAYGESQLTIKTNVCVCVCVGGWGGGGHVYVVYEDTNLYNDMGMT